MIGVFGGSFDPVHIGHLRSALEVQLLTGCRQIRFVPSREPPHRSGPVVSAEHRVEMLRIAISGHPEWVIDNRELHRSGPSYTITTLESLRSEMTDKFCLLVGSDAFVHFESWHRYRDILSLAHVLVMVRPGSTFSEWIKGHEFRERLTENVTELKDHPAGKIHVCEVTALDISSSKIRRCLGKGWSCEYLMPAEEIDFINRNKLYT